ncbi:MAG TPA: hypothetical protein VGC57_10960 [Cellulomonas sp.]
MSTLSLPSASAAESDPEVADATAGVIEAVAPGAGLGDQIEVMNAGTELVAQNSSGVVAVSADPTTAVLIGGEQSFTVGLPDLDGLSTPEIAADGTVVYDSESDAQVAVQAFDNGVRFLAIIDSADAPERYPFPLEVPPGGSLALLEDGTVDLLDGTGAVVATAPAPWAYDSEGRAVPTHFEIDGTTLVQVVEHAAGDFTYPIVADPSWWQITKCAGAIAWVVGSTVFAGAKILQIKRYINALGGVTQTAKLIMGATTAAERARGIGKGLLTLAAIISGADGVMSSCR